MDSNRVFLNAIVPISKNIPAGIQGLSMPLRINRARHDRVIAFIAGFPDKLPLPPGEFFMRPDELSLLPVFAIVQRHFNTLDIGFTRICCAEYHDGARLQLFVIQQGTVTLWNEEGEVAQLRDVRGAGDFLGIEQFNGLDAYPYSAKSASDVGSPTSRRKPARSSGIT